MQGWSGATTDPSRLAACFRDIAAAADAGRYQAAVRFADSARRFAPQNLTATLVYARSLLRVGAQRAALECLGDREDPDSLVLRAEAAFRAGLLQEASRCCGSLLSGYAVDSVQGLPAVAARLCRNGHEFPGWVGVDSALRLVGEIAAGSVATIERDNVHLGRIDRRGMSGPLLPFSIRMPAEKAARVRIRVGHSDLLGSTVQWPADFRVTGWVVLEDRLLSGEVCADWAPRSSVKLVVRCGRHETRLEVQPAAMGIVGWPFSMQLGDFATGSAKIAVSVLLPDGRTTPLTGSPLKLHQPLPIPVGECPSRRGDTCTRLQPRVNIVVPVYSGLEETLTCLHSVLTNVSPDAATLTVVDDASPDAALREVLNKLAGEGRITLLRNPVNLGFPGAVNRGMRLHPERDVVLLNADTEVYEGWLERLISAAYSDPDIGTVTPLGEAASITSYPYDGRQPYTSQEATRIDQIARAVNAGKVVSIPVGVGFCLYLRRRCLDEVGELDEHSFGKGYGEENDFCLRARQRGWRHVAATDVFVRHSGGRSYGPTKRVLTARNSRVINFRYPGYDRLIADFIASGALRESRRAIDSQLLLERAQKPVLIISFDLAGGVQRHIEHRQATLLPLGHTVVVLRATVSSAITNDVLISVPGEDFQHLAYDLPRDLSQLRGLLLDLQLVHIELHHFMGLKASVLEMLTGLGIPYHVFIHDYAWICPRVSLLNAAGVYCGEPAIEACEACVRKNGSAFPEPQTVGDLRRQSRAVLAGASEVIAPTRDVRERLTRYYPELEIKVAPWEASVPPQRPRRRARQDEKLRVGLIGAIGTPKGYSILLECARDSAARDLPIEFVVVGYTRDDRTLLETGRVFVTGPYEEHEAIGLLERECCDIALFPSVCPETWCYTLTYALAARIPIVAFDLGAIAERLRSADTGILLPVSTPALTINDTLLRAASTPFLNINTTSAGIPMQTNDANPVGSAPAELSASVQVITLPVGIYAFTVTSGGAASGNGLALPALQVAPAPLRSRSTIEFLEGPATLDRWLTRRGDVVMVKISAGDATLLLTSLRGPDSSVLSIDVRRLDIVEPTVPVSSSAPARNSPTEVSGTHLPTSTLVHVQNVGDLEFTQGWAGLSAEKLWIEGFAARLPEATEPAPIEYLGINYEGDETSWLSAGALCGSRGAGIPLIAFAVRAKEAAATDYTCVYSGRFLSGTEVGPCSDGSLCRSASEQDPLVAMELRIERRQPAAALASAG